MPSVRTPHECALPAATAVYRPVDSPAGWGAGWGAVRVREELASQLPAVAVVGKKRTRGSCRSPHELSGWRCWRPNSTRPVSSLRATMRTAPTGRSSAELASQLPTVAVVGKKRTRGSCRSPHELSGWRCWRPNSTRPVSSLRATIRTAALSLAVSSWATAAVETTAPPRTASRAMIAAPARRRLPRGPLRAAGTFAEAGRDVMAGSCADRALPRDQPGGSSPVDITHAPDIAHMPNITYTPRGVPSGLWQAPVERTTRSRVIRGSPPRGAARGAPATSTGSSGASV